MDETSRAPEVPAADGGEEEALLARYGVVRVCRWRYEVDGYAYTHPADAIAQAKRASRAGSIWRPS